MARIWDLLIRAISYWLHHSHSYYLKYFLYVSFLFPSLVLRLCGLSDKKNELVRHVTIIILTLFLECSKEQWVCKHVNYYTVLSLTAVKKIAGVVVFFWPIMLHWMLLGYTSLVTRPKLKKFDYIHYSIFVWKNGIWGWDDWILFSILSFSGCVTLQPLVVPIPQPLYLL